MERYSTRTLDEMGRLVLHSELRERLNLDAGTKVSLTLVGTIIALQRIEGNIKPEHSSQINDLGMLELPREHRQTLGWKEKDKIALYHTGNMIILTAT